MGGQKRTDHAFVGGINHAAFEPHRPQPPGGSIIEGCQHGTGAFNLLGRGREHGIGQRDL